MTSSDISTVTLQRACPATIIPSGDVVHLEKGTTADLTQALGGSATLRTAMGLFRVASADFDAFGPEAAAALRASTPAAETQEFSEEAVWTALRGCFDPEIPLNIVDLGLVYDLAIEKTARGGHRLVVKMTLTAPGCGMGPTIAGDAQARIAALPTVEEARVDIVWDPQWTPHMISDAGRQKLGL